MKTIFCKINDMQVTEDQCNNCMFFPCEDDDTDKVYKNDAQIGAEYWNRGL